MTSLINPAAHSIWRLALLILAAAPFLYYILAVIAALCFLRRERRRVPDNFAPPASLLKPVRGVDFGSWENFASFCRQDYPEYEILFAVNDSADPAVPLIQRLIAEFPQRRIRLLVGAEWLGANRKVNKLVRLSREAQHDILVITDGDVRVSPGYLREVIAPLADKQVGAVTSFYRGIAEGNLRAELEAIGASSDFFAGVLVAEWMEGVSFALGASIATTKHWVGQMGGFEAIAGTHSDDYEFGNRIAKAGGTVVLSREAVWTMYPAQTWPAFWRHQIRWARTVRLCRPVSYFGLLLTQGLPWTVLAALIAPAKWIAITYFVAYAVLRFLMAWTAGVWAAGDEILRKKIWLLPLRDAIHFFVWLASFTSNRISWGGEEFIMQKGNMIALDPSESAGRAEPSVSR